MSAVLDYLVKTSVPKANDLISRISHDKVRIQMKVFGSDEVYSVKIRPSAEENIFILQYRGNEFSRHEMLTFRLDMDARMYFFKTEGIAQTKSITLNTKIAIYELIRRKEPRFKVPESWPQFAMVLSSPQKNIKSLARISEISQSGTRLILKPELPRFEIGQKIKIQFKIYKRAQVAVLGTIRHVRKNKSSGPTLGISFELVPVLSQSKIQNICDDIGFYYAHLAKKI